MNLNWLYPKPTLSNTASSLSSPALSVSSPALSVSSPALSVSNSNATPSSPASSVSSPASSVPTNIAPPSAPLFNKTADGDECVTIKIFGVNEPAFGGDVLKISISPIERQPLVGDETLLNVSNSNNLKTFINEKLNERFIKAFNVNLGVGAKSWTESLTGGKTTLNEAIAALRKKYAQELDEIARKKINDFLNDLTNYLNNNPEEGNDTKWRDTDTDYVINGKRMNRNVYYRILIPKGSPASVASSIKANINDPNVIKSNLDILNSKIAAVSSLGDTQHAAIEKLKALIDKPAAISADQLSNLNTNLKNILNPTTGIDTGKYPHMALADGLLKKKSTFGTVGDAINNESELHNILIKKYYLRGGITKKHTKKHTKLQQKRNARKTHKK